MEEFFTRKIADEGRKLELRLPTGEKTDHHMIVAGVDSDRFRVAQVEASRKMLEAQIIKDDDQRKLEEASIQRRFVAALVLGWSFEKECTTENVTAFFKEAPQIETQVDRFSANRRDFFAVKSPS